MSENNGPTVRSGDEARAVYVEVYGPEEYVQRVAGWIESASGTQPLKETIADPESPGWVRCHLVVLVAD